MKECLKKPAILFIPFFLIFVIGLGIMSYYKLMEFYINDAPDINGWVPGSDSKLETDIANNFYGQFDFVNLNGLMSRIIGKKELNRVIRLNNGYLDVPSPVFEDEIINNNTEQIIGLNDYLKQNGIYMIFAITPNTSAKYDSELPVYFSDYGNENLDKIASKLREGGVRVIDYRDELYSDGIDAYDMMYRTDHHWNTRMGFYAYKKLADILEAELDCKIDPQVKDIDSYTVKTYKKWHLGSRGQRTGKYFGGIDDFDLITPNFETCVAEGEGEKEGSYADILINTESLKEKDLTVMRDDVNKRSTYDRVLENSQGDYINYMSHNDKRILMVCDSFGKAVCPFMDISFAHVKWEFGPVSKDTISEFEPDAVVMLYDLSDGFSSDVFNYYWVKE